MSQAESVTDNDLFDTSGRRSESRITRLIHQLLNAAIEPGNGSKARVAAAAVSLEAKVHQIETDLISSQAGKRKAEQETAALRAELTALTRSHAQQKADWQDALLFARSQGKSRSEELRRAEKDILKISNDLIHLKRENDHYREMLASSERDLKDLQYRQRLTLEQKELFEKRALDTESQLRFASSNTAENQSLKEQMKSLKEELKIALGKQEVLGTTNEPCLELKEMVAHRAALAQECKNLRAEVTRLQSVILERETDFERSMQESKKKTIEASYEIESLKTKLEARADAVRAAEASATDLRKEAERSAEIHQSEINSLRENISQYKHEIELIKRRAREDLAGAERKWEAKLNSEIETAVEQYRHRIQDLELQMAHISPEKSSGRKQVHNSQPLGGFAASILDYIPRSEHVRLLQAQSQARNAEAVLQMESLRTQIEETWSKKLEATNEELNEVRTVLEEMSARELEMRQRARQVDQEFEILQNRHRQLENLLEERNNAVKKTNKELEDSQFETKLLQENLDRAYKEKTDAGALWESKIRELQATIEEAERSRKETESDLRIALQRYEDLGRALEESHYKYQSSDQFIEKLKNENKNVNTELEETKAALSRQVEDLSNQCHKLEAQLIASNKQIEALKIQAENTLKENTFYFQNCIRQNMQEMSNLLVPIEAALGLASDPSRSFEARTKVILSRCREFQTEIDRLVLAVRNAVEDEASNKNDFIVSEMQEELQKECDELHSNNEKIGPDRAMRHTNKSQNSIPAVHSMKLRNPISGFHQERIQVFGEDRSASSQENISNRLSTIGLEIELLRRRIGEQADQAVNVEASEKKQNVLLDEIKKLLRSSTQTEENKFKIH